MLLHIKNIGLSHSVQHHCRKSESRDQQYLTQLQYWNFSPTQLAGIVLRSFLAQWDNLLDGWRYTNMWYTDVLNKLPPLNTICMHGRTTFFTVLCVIIPSFNGTKACPLLFWNRDRKIISLKTVFFITAIFNTFSIAYFSLCPAVSCNNS